MVQLEQRLIVSAFRDRNPLFGRLGRSAAALSSAASAGPFHPAASPGVKTRHQGEDSGRGRKHKERFGRDIAWSCPHQL